MGDGCSCPSLPVTIPLDHRSCAVLSRKNVPGSSQQKKRETEAQTGDNTHPCAFIE